MTTRLERERMRSGEEDASPEAALSHRAVVRLRGGAELSPETLLAMAEGVRRALRLVGIVDVQIDVETNDAGAA